MRTDNILRKSSLEFQHLKEKVDSKFQKLKINFLEFKFTSPLIGISVN